MWEDTQTRKYDTKLYLDRKFIKGPFHQFASLMSGLISAFNHTPNRLHLDIFSGDQILNLVSYQLTIPLDDALQTCQAYIDAKLISANTSILEKKMKFKGEHTYNLTPKGCSALLDVEENKIGGGDEFAKLHDFTVSSNLIYVEKTAAGKVSAGYNITEYLFKRFVGDGLNNVISEEEESPTSTTTSTKSVPIKDRTVFLRKFKNTFSGVDAIDWILLNCGVWNREEAANLGALFFQMGWISVASSSSDAEKIIKDGKTNIYQITEKGVQLITNSATLKRENSTLNDDRMLLSRVKQRPVSAFAGSFDTYPSPPAEAGVVEPIKPRGRSATVGEAHPPPINIKILDARRKSVTSAAELSFKETRGAKLNQILETTALLTAYSEFLKQSFCYENLMFWEDVELFRRNYIHHFSGDHQVISSKLLVPHAIAIYLKYIISNSPFEVNIGSNIKSELTKILSPVAEHFERINHDELIHQRKLNVDELCIDLNAFPKVVEGFGFAMYASAQTHIFRLMASDSVPKFTATKAYKEVMEDLKIEVRESVASYMVASASSGGSSDALFAPRGSVGRRTSEMERLRKLEEMKKVQVTM